MPAILAPEGMWRARVEELARDLGRLEALLDSNLVTQHLGLGGKFGQWLGPLEARLRRLERSAAGGVTPQLWADLAALSREHRAVSEAQLGFLGGVTIGRSGLDGGMCRRAQEWLGGYCTRLGLDARPGVISGRGPLVESATGIVRLPFADWELWTLPLLGRAVGLLAAAPGSPYHAALNDFAGAIGDGEWEARLPGVAPARRREYVDSLFADMFATAVVGPVYGLALFALELDYANPEALDLRDSDQIEGRDSAERYLPPSADRAAAVLAVLRAMNGPGSGSQQPYSSAIRMLEGMWRAALGASGRRDPLDAVTQSHGGWHEALYGDAIEPLAFVELPNTRAAWQRSSQWLQALRTGSPPEGLAVETTALLGAIWRLRLEQPEQAANALDVANALLCGKAVRVPLGSPGGAAPAESVIAQARLARLLERWRRIQQILSGAPEDGLRAAIAGRFYRLLSEQEYALEPWLAASRAVKLRTGIWGKMADLAVGARPLQREALEFLGGCLIREQGLDREPATVAASTREGAGICGLADLLLRDYARRTGIDWNARTVLGADPFLETDTEVIRLRFPSWSLWDLPLLAHEFGHLAARATPAFVEYQREQAGSSGMEQRFRHMDEFFADVFATYTLGPAFAFDVVLLQFQPAEAYLARGGHPSHQERARVILQTLAEMNRKGAGAFGGALQQLERAWGGAVAACGTVAADAPAFEKQLTQSLSWGRKIHGFIDKFYRLGAAYTPQDWSRDRQAAGRMLRLPVPALAELAAVGGVKAQEVSLGGILNALWYARASEPAPGVDLMAVAHELGRRFQEAGAETAAAGNRGK